MNDLQKKYIDRYILVGLTYLEEDGSIKDQLQIHGSIVAVSESTIVFKRKDNGEEFSIPFDEDNLTPADPESVYELKTTGEGVKGVNYTSVWQISPPADE